jgi:hypothetical protein
VHHGISVDTDTAVIKVLLDAFLTKKQLQELATR